MSALPGRLPEIEVIIGTPMTIRLAEQLGGVEVYIPKKVDEFHPIAEAIGLANATALSNALGHERIYLPNCKIHLREIRAVEIRRLFKDGVTGAQLARKFKLTERQIRNILSGNPSRGGAFNRPTLFDQE